MLAFVTALPHPQNTRSYARVSELLARSLASVSAQTCDRFAIVVVGNREPTVALPAAARWVGVDFAPAHPEPGPVPVDRLLERAMPDKGAKLAAGMLAARRLQPRHVMCFDYDDLLSRHLAAHAAAHPDRPGWFADRGYVYWEGSGRIVPVRAFAEICGSSFVLSETLLRMPSRLDERSSAEEILGELGEDFVLRLLARHAMARGYLRERGVELEPLPFPAAVWMRGTGENASSWAGYPSLFGSRITTEIREDFALDAPRANLARDLARCPAQSLGALSIMRRRFGLRRTLRETAKSVPRRLLAPILRRD